MLRDDALALRIDLASFSPPPVFELIASAGVAPAEMRRTFNLGVGLLLAVPPGEVERACAVLSGAGEVAFACGEVIARRSAAVELS
jgi:phosphoribosylformylglycinamidine cyclo-ligase